MRRGSGVIAALALLLCAAAPPAAAVEPDEVLANPQLESRARALSAELRCLVCRNETIDDSSAPLARDLRLLLRERLQAGDTDAEALSFITARYGDYALLKPPFKKTLLLWLFAPALLLAGGLYLLCAARAAKRRIAAADKAPMPELSAEEEARLAPLLAAEEDSTKAEKSAAKR